MNFSFCPLASGSSGNAYLVRGDEGLILIDAGISCKKLCEYLEALGCGIKDIDATCITHEHTDHIKSLAAICKKHGRMSLLLSKGTDEYLENIAGVESRILMDAENCLQKVKDLQLQCFSLSHDAAEPIGFSVIKEGRKISFVTDTGIITNHIFDSIKDSDTLVIEANYEEGILNMSTRYPYSVIRRIGGSFGHLSNKDAAKTILEVIRYRKTQGVLKPIKIYLAHISRNHNTQVQAYMTVKNYLFEYDIHEEKDFFLNPLDREFNLQEAIMIAI